MTETLRPFILLSALVCARALATPFPCPNPTVVIEAAPPAQTTSLCAASADALAFLAGYGLTPKRPIRITLVDTPLHSLGHPIYGSYNSRTDQVRIMSFAAIQTQLENPTMYGEAFNPDHYRATIAHEVAHAVVQHNTPLDTISNAAQEYIAHATQLAALPEDQRQRVITDAGVGPWESGDIISEAYMAFAPNRFAVKCYLHLTGHHDPQPFIQILLNHQWHWVSVP